jgi:hypothetical protein
MNDNHRSEDARLGPGGWIAIAVLAAFLGWAIWYAVRTWGALAGVGISTAGWVMLALGVIVTLIVGGGLMALLFYSSRKNYDR